MFNNSTIENIELKLSQSRNENSEKLDKIENEFNNEYWDLFNHLLQNDNLWLKRIISVYFQLQKLDYPEKTNNSILRESLIKWLDTIPLNWENKNFLFSKFEFILKNKNIVSENIIQHSDLKKDWNYAILESLLEYWNLNNNDIINISLKYKESWNFLESIVVLSEEKKELIKLNLNTLKSTSSHQKEKEFKNEFKDEISSSTLIQKYPRIINFIWKNYFKLKIKNKVESKNQRFKRLLKTAFLRLYKLRNLWIDINSIINKIDSLNDFEKLVSLLLKFFEELKQNPSIKQDYIVSDELENIQDLVNKWNLNKEKILFSESKIIKFSQVLEQWEKNIQEQDLEKILSEETWLVWWELINNSFQKTWFLMGEESEDDEIEEEINKQINLEDFLEKLKKELFELEDKKRKMFLNWDFEQIDLINDSLLKLDFKILKVKKILWIDI